MMMNDTTRGAFQQRKRRTSWTFTVWIDGHIDLSGEGMSLPATNNAEDTRARICAVIFQAFVVAGLVALSTLRRLFSEHYWLAVCDVPVRRLSVILCCALWLAQGRELRQAKGTRPAQGLEKSTKWTSPALMFCSYLPSYSLPLMETIY